jgi:hypothetical protein
VRSALTAHGDAGRYEFRLEGQLGYSWTEWFDGFALTNAGDGTTTLTGPVTDQAALHGLLRRVSDVGMTLISVNLLDDHEGPEPPHVGS